MGWKVGSWAKIHGYTEPVFRRQPEGMNSRPDGLLILKTGKEGTPRDRGNEDRLGQNRYRAAGRVLPIGEAQQDRCNYHCVQRTERRSNSSSLRDYAKKNRRVGEGLPRAGLWSRPTQLLGGLDALRHFLCPDLDHGDQARSKRSAFITLFQAATKSFTNFSFESALP